jgi:hypothetical protein
LRWWEFDKGLRAVQPHIREAGKEGLRDSGAVSE